VGSAASKYDYGKTPSVAINTKGYVVEIHQSQRKKELWYHVGLIQEDNVHLGPSIKFDKGQQPSVTMDDAGHIIEVHNSDNRPALFYRAGTIDIQNQKIKWSAVSFTNYDAGVSPTVAMNNVGHVVEIHKSENRDLLWVKYGKHNPSEGSVGWTESVRLVGGRGTSPSVSIDDVGFVVVAFSGSESKLYCVLGKLNYEKSKIEWEQCVKYGTGFTPSIFLHNSRRVILEVHKSPTEDEIFYKVGKLDSKEKTITWSDTVGLDEGITPRIAMDGLFNIIEVHKSEVVDSLWCRIGKCDEKNNVSWIKNPEK